MNISFFKALDKRYMRHALLAGGQGRGGGFLLSNGVDAANLLVNNQVRRRRCYRSDWSSSCWAFVIG